MKSSPLRSLFSLRFCRSFRCGRLARWGNGLLLSALAVVSLTGCQTRSQQIEIKERSLFRQLNEVKDMAPNEFSVQPRIDPTTGKSVPIPNDLKASPRLTVNVAHTAPVRSMESMAERQAQGEDYRNKCDVYWHLNWLRKELLRGILPYDLPNMVKQSRRQMLLARQDSNYRLADDALIDVETALKCLADQRAMRDAGVETRDIPWGRGTEAVRRYFATQKVGGSTPASTLPTASRRLPFDDTGDDVPLARSHAEVNTALPAPSSAQIIALDYELRCRASPQTAARLHFENAIRTANKLRDELGLRNRRENNDGDGYHLSSDLGQSGLLLGGEGMGG